MPPTAGALAYLGQSCIQQCSRASGNKPPGLGRTKSIEATNTDLNDEDEVDIQELGFESKRKC